MGQDDNDGQRTLQDRFDTRRLADRLDEHTIAFPVYDGNGMFLSMGNVEVHSAVGILFIDFERGTRLRFNGVATIAEDDPLVETYPGAQLVVRVRGEAGRGDGRHP